MSFTRSRFPSLALRRAVAGLATCTVLLGAACTSDSGDSATGGSGSRPPAEQGAGEGSPQAEEGAASNTDVDEIPVCDVIEPVVDEMVAAAALDLPLADDSPSGQASAGCELRFAGPEATITVTIGRVPAVISTVDAMVSSLVDVDPLGPVPSLGDDAQLLEDSMDGSGTYVLFSGNGRVWQVRVSGSSTGAVDAAGSGNAEIGTAIAEVLKTRVEHRASANR